jgi:hypothetical protein
MSLDQLDLEAVCDRTELQQLSIKQLCKLLSITIQQLNICGFSKDNLIEMVLTNQPEL